MIRWVFLEEELIFPHKFILIPATCLLKRSDALFDIRSFTTISYQKIRPNKVMKSSRVWVLTPKVSNWEAQNSDTEVVEEARSWQRAKAVLAAVAT